jgi:hypothetical protein
LAEGDGDGEPCCEEEPELPEPDWEEELELPELDCEEFELELPESELAPTTGRITSTPGPATLVFSPSTCSVQDPSAGAVAWHSNWTVTVAAAAVTVASKTKPDAEATSSPVSVVVDPSRVSTSTYSKVVWSPPVAPFKLKNSVARPGPPTFTASVSIAPNSCNVMLC